MNPTEQFTIEQIKQIFLKSSFAQIREAFVQLQNLKNDIDDVYTQLNKKVNLVSDMLDGQTTSKVLGPGTVSATGTAVVGVGTNFIQYVSISDQIQIGAELVTVLSIQDDTHLTVTTAFLSVYTNSIYAIVRPATRERLIGDFEFGQLNGQQFRGVIQEGSFIEHYGRIATPNDLVNVKFLQKSVSPAILLAQNAIKRSGDKVGVPFVSGIPPTLFQFINTMMTFDEHSNVYYNGTIDDISDLGKTQFATVGYAKQRVDLAISEAFAAYAASNFYSQWLYIDDLRFATGMTTYGFGSVGWYNLFNSNSSYLKFNSNLNSYFDIIGEGLTCKKACDINIVMSGFGGTASIDSHTTGISGMIAKDSAFVSYALSEAGGSHSGHFRPSVTCNANIPCIAGSIVRCGIRDYASSQDLHASVSVHLLR